MQDSKYFGISSLRQTILLFFCGLFALTSLSRAAIVAPYTPDSSTLHLWHLDATAVPAPDFALGGTNMVSLLYGATLGDASYAGFGNSVNTVDGGQDLFAATNRDALISPSAATPPGNISFPYTDPTSGAFTFEALVWIDFDPAKNLGTTANGGNNRNLFMQIMTCESTATANRIFQFRICPKGVALIGTTVAAQPYLTFENIRMVSGNQPTIYAPIPITGPDAIVSNAWYHVAVTYNGVPTTTDNFKFYWTLVDPTRTAANLLTITSTQTTLNGPNPIGTASSPFVIGNTARSVTAAGNNFLGKIDEVRISKVARAADKMIFSANPEVVVTESPVGATVAVGMPVSFQVAATGQTPLSFQWQHSGTNLPGATQFAYSIASAQASDAGTYTIIVSNSLNAVTNSAVLNIRTAINLTWSGSAGANWDTSTINWDSDNDTFADLAFSQGDVVLFNDQGNSASPINLTGSFYASAFTVNSANNYTLTSSSGGGVIGVTGLTKSGSGTLILDMDNTYSGPTVIQSGLVQVGTGANRGSLGTGSVTNNGALVISRTGGFTIGNFAGSGTFTNNGGNPFTISGTNTFAQPIIINSGAVTLATAQSKGPSTEYTLHALGNATSLSVGGGVTFDPGTTISLLDSTASPDNRCSLNAGSDTNTFNGTIVLSGDGNIQFASTSGASNSLFRVITPSISSPGYTGQLILRGVGNGIITSQMTFGGKISKTDGGIWTIYSTNNSWVGTDVAGGTLRLGADGALPSALTLNVSTATLDLNGFNQQVGPLAGSGTGIIGNSSTTSDSILTVNPPSPSLFSGVIRDSVINGTKRTGLTIAGGNQSLGGTNTYTGPTTILAGVLTLIANGSCANSSIIDVRSGAILNPGFRNDQTLVLGATQTLKGEGAITVWGKIINNGTIELKLNKTEATLSNDSISCDSAVTFGGTLKLNITASPALTTNDSFQVFSAPTYSGTFSTFVPSAPAAGLAWDTNTLASDGILRIAVSSVNGTPTNIMTQISGNQLMLSWPFDHTGWRLQSQTNGVNVGISNNWFDVAGSTATNSETFTLDPTKGAVFFRMIYP